MRSIDENVEKLRRCDTTLCYTFIEGDCRTHLIVWGQPNSGAFKVNVDPINSLALSESFLLDEVHLLHVNADATSLPSQTVAGRTSYARPRLHQISNAAERRIAPVSLPLLTRPFPPALAQTVSAYSSSLFEGLQSLRRHRCQASGQCILQCVQKMCQRTRF